MVNLLLDLLLIRSQFVQVCAQVLRSAIPLALHNAVNETSMKSCRATKTSRWHERRGYFTTSALTFDGIFFPRLTRLLDMDERETKRVYSKN